MPFDKNAKIPKIIWQTYYTHKIPHLARTTISKILTLNPEYEYRLCNDDEITDILYQFAEYDLKGSEFQADYLEMLKTAPTKALYADMFRYVALYKIGGIYLDVDVEVLKPFREWPGYPWDNISIVLSPEALYTDTEYQKMCVWGFIGAPGHPIFLKIIMTTLEVWVQQGRKWDTGMSYDMMFYYTGPMLIIRAVSELLGYEFNFGIDANLAMTLHKASIEPNQKGFEICQQYQIKIEDPHFFDNEDYVRHLFWSKEVNNKKSEYKTWVEQTNYLADHPGEKLIKTLDKNTENEYKNFPNFLTYLINLNQLEYEQIKLEISTLNNQIREIQEQINFNKNNNQNQVQRWEILNNQKKEIEQQFKQKQNEIETQKSLFDKILQEKLNHKQTLLDDQKNLQNNITSLQDQIQQFNDEHLNQELQYAQSIITLNMIEKVNLYQNESEYCQNASSHIVNLIAISKQNISNIEQQKLQILNEINESSMDFQNNEENQNKTIFMLQLSILGLVFLIILCIVLYRSKINNLLQNHSNESVTNLPQKHHIQDQYDE